MDKAPEKLLRIMQVAVLIQKRYQKARDLMLSGVFGPVDQDEDGKLVVRESAVLTWKATQAADVTPPVRVSKKGT